MANKLHILQYPDLAEEPPLSAGLLAVMQDHMDRSKSFRELDRSLTNAIRALASLADAGDDIGPPADAR